MHQCRHYTYRIIVCGLRQFYDNDPHQDLDCPVVFHKLHKAHFEVLTLLLFVLLSNYIGASDACYYIVWTRIADTIFHTL